MGAEDGGGTRIEAAGAELRERLGGLAPSDAVRIVGAGPTPSVLYEGAAGGAGAAVEGLSAGSGPANLTAALRLAAGLRAGNGDEIVLMRAPEEAEPKVTGGGSNYETVTVGEPVSDVSLGATSAHCDLLGTEACEVFVRLTDHGDAAATVPVRVEVQGGETVSKSVEVPAGGTAPLVFTATPGAKVKVSVPAADDGLGGRQLGLRLGPRTGRRADHAGRPTHPRPAARPRPRLGPRGEPAAADAAVLQGERPGDERPAGARRLHPQGRPAEGAGAARRPPAELPRRHGPRQDEGQPHERHRSGEPAARRGRPGVADDRRRGLAAAGAAGRVQRHAPGARKAR